MILDNLTRAFRTQNWLAAGVEFVIVIAGVVIGFQISSWNEARMERRVEREALERLFLEARNNTAYSALILYRAERLQADRAATAARLRGETAEAGDPVAGLAVMSLYRDMTPIRSAYDQLAFSGGLASIQSQEVRDALALYEGVVGFHDRAREEYMNRASDIAALASPYLQTRSAPQGGPYIAAVDWAAAGQDRDLTGAVDRMLAEQGDFNGRRVAVANQVRLLCDALGEALQRPCDPPDWIAEEIAREQAAAGQTEAGG